MHVLLISMWYAPEPVSKPHDLAVELVKRGHRVTVITGFPNYPTGQIYKGYRVRLSQWETMDGVRVLRVPCLVDRSRSAMRRVLSYTTFTLAACLAGGGLVERPDAIWTYQIGMPGILLARYKRAPLIHEVQDLWPEWGENAMVGLRSWLFSVLEAQERYIRRRATILTTISAGFKQVLVAKGSPADRVQIIPNWANEDNFRPVPRDEGLGEREGLAGRFNIIYGGNVGSAQALGVVLDAAGLLRDLPQVQFVIIGDGIERKQLMQRMSELRLQNVRFLGSRPPEQMAGYFSFADALFLHLKRDPVYEITIPSKTYSYLATGLPILAAAAGDVADLVRKAKAGIVCPPEDPSILAASVRQLYTMPVTERQAMGEAGRSMFLEKFTRAVLVDQYELLLNTLEGSDSLGSP